MLVLGRFVGEKILIGDDIIIEVIEVRNGRVKLGIVAPSDIEVDREEIRGLKK